MSLIDRCLCGARAFNVITRNDLRVAVCVCGMEHLALELAPAEYEAQYRGDYHRAVDRHPGCIPYRERYLHDKQVAERRWHRYAHIVGDDRLARCRSALDVGAANGAWVDFLRELGIDAHGIDPDPAMARGTITTGTAAALNHGATFDLVTYHDVLEHTLDPRTEVLHAARLCAPGALLVLDVPDVSVDAGRHHYKAEHPWYFTDSALQDLLTHAGFEVLALDRPLPGKMVAYGQAE